MTGKSIVLDNVVLSGFHVAGWFSSLEFWRPEYELLTPMCIWEDEFVLERDIDDIPSWLTVETCEVDLESEQPGALSEYDWSCIALAKDKDAFLVTRDKALKEAAEELGIVTMWDGRFLLDTFQQCGISQEEYDDGVCEFLEDAWLSDSVSNVIQEAEK